MRSQEAQASRQTTAPIETDSVNSPANLDLRELLRALQSVRDGDFSVRLPSDRTGLAGKVADTFNEIVVANPVQQTRYEQI